MNNLLGFKGGFEQAEQSVNLNSWNYSIWETKEKEKWIEPKRTVGHCQVDQYHIMGVPEGEEWKG